jgi:hypothetical protein
MNILLTIPFNSDVYEISFHDLHIVRIIRYWEGTQHRQELGYDQLPEQVKEKVLDEMEKLILNDA